MMVVVVAAAVMMPGLRKMYENVNAVNRIRLKIP
jgi:hypothetical protein